MVSLKLFDFPLAYNPAKPRLALIEKGLPYKTHFVNVLNGDSLSPAFLKINPNASVPALQVDDSKLITESKDSVEYIDKIGTPLGGDAVDPAKVQSWVEKCAQWDGNLYIAANADSGLKGILNSVTQYKIKVAEARKKQHPDLAETYDRKVQGLQASLVVDPAKVKENDDILKDILTSADDTLKIQDFLAGSKYSLADVMFTVVLWRIGTVSGKSAELIEPLPSVSKYFKAVQARPSYKQAFAASGGFGAAKVVIPSLLKVKFCSLTGRY